ncbi:MAG: helix-turn-helix domain-containing protein [Clostridia bacterium]|nr:helix-turn-helix domain-containing protein [Clostridia bacterium]
MERYVHLEELQRELCRCELAECVRQTWNEGRSWREYERTPRFADALMIVCSEMEAVFVCSDGRRIRARKGDCIYIPRGAMYRVSFTGGGSTVDSYTVNFLLLDREGSELRIGHELCVLTDGVGSEVLATLSAFASATVAVSPNRLRQQGCLFSLLAVLSQRAEDRSDVYYPIRKGVRLLVKEWDQNRPVSVYAEACGVSETCFYQHFRAWSGVSPVEYRNQMRMAAAASLLRHSNFSIRQIASQVGFDDPYYFSRLFKEKNGSSPKAYRTEQRESVWKNCAV